MSIPNFRFDTFQKVENREREKLKNALFKWIEALKEAIINHKLYKSSQEMFDGLSDQVGYEVQGQNPIFQVQYDIAKQDSKTQEELKTELLQLIDRDKKTLKISEGSIQEIQNIIESILNSQIETIQPTLGKLQVLESHILDRETHQRLVVFQNDMGDLINEIDDILLGLTTPKSNSDLNGKIEIRINQLNLLKSNAQTLKAGTPKSLLRECQAKLNLFFDEKTSTKQKLDLANQLEQANLEISKKIDSLDLILIDFGLNYDSIQKIHTELGLN
jgi:hypothetical protein